MKKMIKAIAGAVALGIIALIIVLVCLPRNSKQDSTKGDETPSNTTPTTNVDYVFSVGSPNNAPGVAIAEYVTTYTATTYYKFGLTADTLKAAFLNGTYDAIVAPVNLGAAMYKNNQKYKLVSVITWGNLFFASAKENFSINDLNGADVVMFGQGTVNDVVIKYALQSKNITLGDGTRYLDSTNETKAQLEANPNGIYLVAEPALSAAKTANSNIKSISVQDLYKEASGKNSYPQAGLFIKASVLEEYPEDCEKFISRIKTSVEKTSTELEAVAGYAEALQLGGKKPILMKAIPNSNIKYVKASDAKSDIEAVVALNPKLFGGAAPANEFYYA